MRIAVIGSGIAGLAATSALRGDHEVTVYERHGVAGMGASSLALGDATVDVPLRVFYRGYYPNLSALYREVGIETAAVDYASSFSTLGGPTYFRYRNWLVAGRSIPWVGPRALFQRRSRRILRGLARYFGHRPHGSDPGGGDAASLAEHLDACSYPSEFVEDFLLPAMAGICTCSYASVRRYPAHVIRDYLTGGVFLEGVSRAVGGSPEVVAQLLAGATLRAATAVVGLEVRADGVVVADDAGGRQHFDHVVVATQANQAARLLSQADPALGRLLGRFTYEASEVVVHSDRRLAPARPRDWASVNFLVCRRRDKPMATIWLNAVQPELRTEGALFQTWNPLIEPRADTVLARSRFERPVVDADSEAARVAIEALQARPGRRLWVCGSYAARGIPLLESGVTSALIVARAISGAQDAAPMAQPGADAEIMA